MKPWIWSAFFILIAVALLAVIVSIIVAGNKRLKKTIEEYDIFAGRTEEKDEAEAEGTPAETIQTEQPEEIVLAEEITPAQLVQTAAEVKSEEQPASSARDEDYANLGHVGVSVEFDEGSDEELLPLQQASVYAEEVGEAAVAAPLAEEQPQDIAPEKNEVPAVEVKSAEIKSENAQADKPAKSKSVAKKSARRAKSGEATQKSSPVGANKEDTMAEKNVKAGKTAKTEKDAKAEKSTKATPITAKPIKATAAPAAEKSTKAAPKVYHIAQRKEDLKWQVKAAGGNKALKLFNTQAEAIDYAKQVAGNQEARIVIHKVDGSFRKLTY